MKLLRKTPDMDSTKLSRQEALACIPIVNASIACSETDSGEVMLEYPLPMRPFLKSILERFQGQAEQPVKKLQLDQLGTSVWRLIDGKHSVQTIVESFAASHNISLQESEQSVTAFLSELGKRGIIALA